MARISIITFFCCLLYFQGAAQVVKPTQEEATSILHDTSLVNLYIKKALPFALNPKTPDSADFYLKKIYALSQYRHFDKGIIEYYRIKAAGYYIQHKYDSLRSAMAKAFYYATSATNSRELALVNDLRAWVFQNREEYDSAAKYYIRALHIADSLHDHKFSSEIDTNLSVLFWGIKDFKKASFYALKSYKAGKILNDSLLIVNGLFNLGNAKWGDKQYDTALVLFRRVALIIHDPQKYNYVLIRALANEAGTLSDMGKTAEAIKQYKKVLQFAPGISPQLLPFIYNGLGEVQLKTNHLKDAEENISKAITIAGNTDERLGLRDSYLYMSQLKKDQNQFAEALAFHEKYDSLKDTLAGESTKKNMHLLEMKFQTANKDKQIAEQNLMLTQRQRAIERKNTWIWIIIVGLIALAVIFVLSWRSYRHKRNLHLQSLLTLQKQHELNTLKTKMDAREEERNRIGREIHDDVGSALTTILYLSDDLKSNIREDGRQTAERIADTAGSVVDKMNEIIWSMNREYDTLDDLIAYTRQHAAEFLDNYKLAYRFETPDPVPDIHLQGEQRRNIYLVIKETLHNVVKHACATEVSINFHLNDNLGVMIHDNGKGINRGDPRRFGNGLRNMKQRMESIGGSFDIINEEGTTVKLQCPLEKKQNRETSA